MTLTRRAARSLVQNLLQSRLKKNWPAEVTRIDGLMRRLLTLSDDDVPELLVELGVWTQQRLHYPQGGYTGDPVSARFDLFKYLRRQRSKTWKESKQHASANDEPGTRSETPAGAGQL